MSRAFVRPLLLMSVVATLAAASALAREAAAADLTSGSGSGACAGLPGHEALRNALMFARGQDNGGFGLDMWGAVVNRDGIVCAVAFTGADRGRQWPGSRVIAAQKANTANAFSLPTLALSTANLWAAVQPGGSLYGLQHSNPVSTDDAYEGPPLRSASRTIHSSARASVASTCLAAGSRSTTRASSSLVRSA
jgi:hypothetical protein